MNPLRYLKHFKNKRFTFNELKGREKVGKKRNRSAFIQQFNIDCFFKVHRLMMVLYFTTHIHIQYTHSP